MISEYPIHLSSQDVVSILEGRKSQIRIPITRVRGIYGGIVTDFSESDTPGYNFSMRDRKKRWNELTRIDLLKRCPFGGKGDHLWGKETFCIEHMVFEEKNQPPHSDGRPIMMTGEFDDEWIQPHYKATDPDPELCYEDSDGEPTVRWKSPVNMPRWVSRITLEITDISVQRLQDITEEQAILEGARRFDDLPSSHPYKQDDRWSMEKPEKTSQCLGTARMAFANYWNKNYEKKGFGWDRNPWVWVIDFRKKE